MAALLRGSSLEADRVDWFLREHGRPPTVDELRAIREHQRREVVDERLAR